MKQTLLFLLFTCVVSSFYGQQKNVIVTRHVASAPTMLSQEVYDAFQDYCISCHGQYQNERAILGNKQAIVSRISWLKNSPDNPPKNAMPFEGDQRDSFRNISPALYDSMISELTRSRSTTRPAEDSPLSKIKLPPGFSIELLSVVPGARSMVQGEEGMIFIGTGGFANALDKVYVLWDKNKNDKIEKTEMRIIAENLDNPNGVAFRKGTLYIAEENSVKKFENITEWVKSTSSEDRLASDKLVSLADFENHGGHSWKYIRFGRAPKDHLLFVTVGAPCNVCLDPGFAAIYTIDVNTGKKEIYAEGVRNSVGFDFHPVSGDLWFTENGRDSLGDNFPPDELNTASAQGQHFGFPYCHGLYSAEGKDRDPDFGKEDCKKFKAPVVALGAHVAALGLRFYTGTQFPADYKNQIFIAEHGSWNRSQLSGYQVSLVKKNPNGSFTYTPFAKGWLNDDQSRWGRPVDVESLPNGDLLISDDGVPGSFNKGAIYRVRYKKL